MALFSFTKHAGDTVFGIDETEKKDYCEGISDEFELQKIAEKKLKDTISNLQLQIEHLNIFIDEDIALISGTTDDQAEKEKAVLVVGNTKGITLVDDQLTVKNNQPEAQFYSVNTGDTLGKIAKEFYGDATKHTLIFEANKPMLTLPDNIYPGQLLRIPVV